MNKIDAYVRTAKTARDIALPFLTLFALATVVVYAQDGTLHAYVSSLR